MFWKRLSYFDKFGGVSEEQKLFKGQIGISEWNKDEISKRVW